MEIQAMRPVWALTGEQLLTELDVLHAQIASLQTRRLHVMAGIDNLGYAKEIGATDTVRLLAFRHRLDTTAVRRDLKLAKALPKYELVSAALPDPSTPNHDNNNDGSFQDGSCQHDQPTMQDNSDPAPCAQPTVGSEITNDENAQTRDADHDGANAADRHQDGVNAKAVDADQDGVNAEHGGHPAGNAGPVVLHPAQADAIVSALEQIPARANVPPENLQVAEAQMVEAARHLSPKDLRMLGATVRDRLDTDGPEPAEDKAAAKEALWLKAASKGVRFGGFLANENAELLQTLIEAGAGPKKTPDGNRDPRSRTKRQADALVNILNAAAESGDAAPGHGGIKPCLMVTMDLDALKAAGARATGDLQFGEGLSAAAVRRLACDANVIPIVLGANSEPLDVGRAKRFVTEAMRQALIARDRGCVTCGAPPDQCDAHHIVSWIDGGLTSLDNLALQCKPDHRAVHRGEFIITITDGIVHVSRPTWAETGPTPTRTRNRPQPGEPTLDTAPDAPDAHGSAGSAGAASSPGAAGPPGTAAAPRADGSAGATGPSGVADSAGSAEAAGSSGADGSAGAAGSPGSPGAWGDPPDPGENHGERPAGRSPEDARAWPWTNDPKPLTREAAIQLAPRGDNEDDNAPPAPREPTPPPAWVSPWGDDHDEPRSATSDDKVAPTRVSPWGDDPDEPRSGRSAEKAAAAQATPWDKPAQTTPGDNLAGDTGDKLRAQS